MKPTLLITGCAGFIGRAACEYFKYKYEIIGLDDLSRSGSKPPGGVKFIRGRVRDHLGLIYSADAVLHLAAQVSVVESYRNPWHDWECNAGDTMILAHSVGAFKPDIPFIYASTNKVFGELPGVSGPILDSQPLNPQTPYGISKAAAGLYVREFLPNSGYVFHMGCIYGETQPDHASEDQGWVGWLIRQIRDGKPIKCYGDGSQVRDLLHVSDLLQAYEMALEWKVEPGCYGVGGGYDNSAQLSTVVAMLGGKIDKYAAWRQHDQRCCIMASDGLRRAGWEPQISAAKWLYGESIKIEAARDTA